MSESISPTPTADEDSNRSEDQSLHQTITSSPPLKRNRNPSTQPPPPPPELNHNKKVNPSISLSHLQNSTHSSTLSINHSSHFDSDHLHHLLQIHLTLLIINHHLPLHPFIQPLSLSGTPSSTVKMISRFSSSSSTPSFTFSHSLFYSSSAVDLDLLTSWTFPRLVIILIIIRSSNVPLLSMISNPN